MPLVILLYRNNASVGWRASIIDFLQEDRASSTIIQTHQRLLFETDLPSFTLSTIVCAYFELFFFRLFLELPTNAQMSKWLQFCFCHSSIYCAFLLLILICRTIKETKYRFQVACYLNCLSNSSQLCMCFMFVCDGNYFTVTCKSTQCIIVDGMNEEDQYTERSSVCFKNAMEIQIQKKKWKYFHEFQFN